MTPTKANENHRVKEVIDIAAGLLGWSKSSGRIANVIGPAPKQKPTTKPARIIKSYQHCSLFGK